MVGSALKSSHLEPRTEFSNPGAIVKKVFDQNVFLLMSAWSTGVGGSLCSKQIKF